MSRRSLVLTVICLLLGVGLLATVLVGLLRYQSRWYKQAGLPAGIERRQHSDAFLSALSELWNAFHAQRGEWGARFTDVQINSYLEEGIRLDSFESQSLPEGISEPRIAFDRERIRLAFRYGRGMFSTVISIDLRVWLSTQERNVLVLELERFRAGALPISSRSLLEKISEVGRPKGIGVTWYRNHQTGHPVAVLRFQDDQPKPTLELIAVQPEPGTITIHGLSTDGGAAQ